MVPEAWAIGQGFKMVTICNVDDYIVSGAQLALKRARKAEHGRETQTNINTVSSYKSPTS